MVAGMSANQEQTTDLRRLGERLKSRSDDVVRDMVRYRLDELSG